MEYPRKAKIFLFSTGAIVFWICLFLYSILLNGIRPIEDKDTSFFVAIMIITISLLCSFLFWGMVTLANKHPKQWIIVSSFSLIFNVYVAFVSNTVVKDWKIVGKDGIEHITFSYLTGEKDISLGAIKEKDYFVILTYVPVEGESGWRIYDSNHINSAYVIELNEVEEDVMKVIGPSNDLKVQLNGKEWRNGDVKVFYGEDFNKVVNDYRTYKEKRIVE